MQTITREKVVKTNEIVYVAIDGTEFTDAQQCEKYENSALAVLKSRFNKLIISTGDMWDLVRGCDDHTYYIVAPRTDEEASIILQLWYHYNPHLLTRTEEFYVKLKERVEKAVLEAPANKDYLILVENCEGDLYTIDTVKSYIDNLTKACHPVEE